MVTGNVGQSVVEVQLGFLMVTRSFDYEDENEDEDD
jgi:hypothetical protein